MTISANTQTGTAAQGDAACIGGGGNVYDYQMDAEV